MASHLQAASNPPYTSLMALLNLENTATVKKLKALTV
jgi:hypothetical protein